MRFGFGRHNYYYSRLFGIVDTVVGEEAEELAFSGMDLRGEKKKYIEEEEEE